MRARVLFAVAVLASSFAATCGDNRFPITILAQQSLDAYCDRATRCGVYLDVNACEFELHTTDAQIPAAIAHLQDPAVIAAVEAGTMSYDPEQARACIDATAALSCSRASQDVRTETPACATVFVGTVATAGPCVFDDECASRRCTPAVTCVDDYTCCVGTCSTPPHTVAIGGACQIDSDCAIDALCTGAGCQALLGSGEVCSASAECAFDLVCATPAIGQSGVCAPAPHIGDACIDNACADIGARCDATGTCVAVGLPGQPCDRTTDCGEDQVCALGVGSGSGSGTGAACQPAPKLGEACIDLCAVGAWCNNVEGAGGICDAPLANGMTCESSDECASSFCADGEFATTCIDRPVCF